MSTLITALPKDEFAPEENYPPHAEENAALVLLLDQDRGIVLAHKGRYLWGQIACAGFTFEEAGFERVPEEPGYYALRNGTVNVGEDWAEIDGDWREATLADFAFFDVEPPAFAREANSPTKAEAER